MKTKLMIANKYTYLITTVITLGAIAHPYIYMTEHSIWDNGFNMGYF